VVPEILNGVYLESSSRQAPALPEATAIPLVTPVKQMEQA